MDLTPRGCSSIGGELALSMENTRSAAMSFFASYGYNPFNPAEFHLLEGAMKHLPRRRRERLLAFTSPYGEPCCMRTDITLSALAHISDHCAPSDFPMRLCYAERVFASPRPPRQNLEEAQIGAELIGWESPGSEIEVISMLMYALDALAVDDPVIVIGDASIMSSLLEGVADDVRARAVEQIQDGDINGWQSTIKGSDISQDKMRELNALPWLKGGIDVIDEAEGILHDSSSIDRIRGICCALDELGFADRVRIDLGFVRDLDYYTGPIFNVYSATSGTLLGGGGTYSASLQDASLTYESVGFGLSIRELAQSRMLDERPLPVVIWAGEAYSKVMPFADGLAKRGLPFLISWDRDMDSSREYAASRGAGTWINVRDGWSVDVASGRRTDGLDGWRCSK